MQVVVYSQMQNLSFVLFLPVFVGYLTTALTYHIKTAVENRRKNGAWWTMKTSVYL